MIFQHEQEVSVNEFVREHVCLLFIVLSSVYTFSLLSYAMCSQSKNRPHLRGEYNVYSTFQSHEPEFDYLKSLEIEEKINKIRWLPQQNAAHFLLSTNGKLTAL